MRAGGQFDRRTEYWKLPISSSIQGAELEARSGLSIHSTNGQRFDDDKGGADAQHHGTRGQRGGPHRRGRLAGAAVLDPADACATMAANIRRVLRGAKPLGVVERPLGY
jgi:hypothetical protein